MTVHDRPGRSPDVTSLEHWRVASAVKAQPPVLRDATAKDLRDAAFRGDSAAITQFPTTAELAEAGLVDPPDNNSPLDAA